MKTTTIAQRIIETIKLNRISTTEVADALGKRHVMQGLLPVTHDLHCVGPVRPIFTAYNSNYGIHDQVRAVEPDEVVVVYTHQCEGRAILGDLVAKFVTLYRRAAAIAVDGLVRDAARLRRERYPVWSTGVTPLGCYNVEGETFPRDIEAEIRSGVEGGIAVCDDGGVVVIPAAEANEATLEKLNKIELQEDIWYYCLNVLKWDTKRIVVDRDYLKEPGLLPAAYAEAVKSLERRLDDNRQT
jgi:4-hydroxy-4-methyl-2-oxoglutarate aldolase